MMDWTLFLIFTFAFGFLFLREAISVDPVSSVPRPFIWSVLFPPGEEIVNLSAVNSSVVPSSLINEYLSGVNGKNTSLSSAVIVVDNLFSVILTLNVFLIVRIASVKLTLSIFSLGSAVNNELSVDGSRGVVKTFKSVTLVTEVGNLPPAIPVTVVTPTKSTWDEPIDTILPNTGSWSSPTTAARSLYWIKLPSLIAVPGKSGLVLLTVLIPPWSLGVMVATPTFKETDWIVSPLKVWMPVVPSVVPYTDFTSPIPWAVAAIAILPFKIPSKKRGSFAINSPLVSYKVTVLLFDTADLINAVAPLLWPLIKVGTDRLVAWFNVSVVNDWTS